MSRSIHVDLNAFYIYVFLLVVPMHISAFRLKFMYLTSVSYYYVIDKPEYEIRLRLDFLTKISHKSENSFSFTICDRNWKTLIKFYFLSKLDSKNLLEGTLRKLLLKYYYFYLVWLFEICPFLRFRFFMKTKNSDVKTR